MTIQLTIYSNDYTIDHIHSQIHYTIDYIHSQMTIMEYI